MLDSSPTAVINGKTPDQLMNLRERNPDKELAGNFRFKAKNYLEKLNDSISAKNATFLSSKEHYSPRVYAKNGMLRKNLIAIVPRMKKLKDRRGTEPAKAPAPKPGMIALAAETPSSRINKPAEP